MVGILEELGSDLVRTLSRAKRSVKTRCWKKGLLLLGT